MNGLNSAALNADVANMDTRNMDIRNRDALDTLSKKRRPDRRRNEAPGGIDRGFAAPGSPLRGAESPDSGTLTVDGLGLWPDPVRAGFRLAVLMLPIPPWIPSAA